MTPELAERTSKRLQLRRQKGYVKPEGAIVVSRPSVFGNPWRVSDPVLPGDRARVVETFRKWLENNEYPPAMSREAVLELVARRARLLERLPELRGLDLLCWCPLGEPDHCHAAVLLIAANRESP